MLEYFYFQIQDQTKEIKQIYHFFHIGGGAYSRRALNRGMTAYLHIDIKQDNRAGYKG